MAVLTGATANTIDRLTRERQIKSAERELNDLAGRVPKEQQSLTSWDEAWLHTIPKFDAGWIDENIGRYMHTYFNDDDVVVVSPQGKVVLASFGNELMPPMQNLASPFTAAIAKLRGELEAGMDLRDKAISGFFDVRGRIAIASVAPIIPYTDAYQVTEPPYIHITVKYLDHALSELRTTQELIDANAVEKFPGAAYEALPLAGFDGRNVGYMTWRPYRPGSELIWQVGPAAGLVALVLLLVSISMSRKLLRQSAELTTKEAQARHLAFHDPLTGLANRALLSVRLDEAMARNADGRVAVHYLDLDRFKDINDTLGHAAGDAYLREIAARLSGLVGPLDVVARFGGDEFVVLQDNVRDDCEAMALAEKINAAAKLPTYLGEETVQLSASIGIAVSEHGINSAELLRRADICLYRAKSAGRNGYLLFSPDMDELVQQKRLLEVDLAAAMVRRDQLRLAYQPVFAADGKTIEGAEALVRWRHPDLGELSPQLFIQIAEECGLIIPLGEWILREACSQAAKWDIGYVAVNVSPVQVRKSDFAGMVDRVLRETGLSAERLELEVTEGFLMDKAHSHAALSALRALGVRVALDDFGTGYSSLSYLRQYEIDKIKIDQSFVRQSAEASARSIIVAMVQLAKALDMRVTAEGVETAEQKDFLTEVGCHQLQGYFLARPESAADFQLRLARLDRPAA